MKPPTTCPFCDAPKRKDWPTRARIEDYKVWAEYTCGTSKGAKGSKWLWFQTYQCKENAKQSKQ